MAPTDPCPCGSGEAYGQCCAPLHLGSRQARTPGELMRSRYSAYVLWLPDHLLRTWHPRTRPESLEPTPGLVWTGLEILDEQDDRVEFVAHCRVGGRAERLHERSTFAQRAGRWFYVDGVVD